MEREKVGREEANVFAFDLYQQAVVGGLYSNPE